MILIFLSKCSTFHAHFRNAIKNAEKVFLFSDNGVGYCCRKFCILRREYLSSAVNVLTNSLNISNMTKADIMQPNLSQIYGKVG